MNYVCLKVVHGWGGVQNDPTDFGQNEATDFDGVVQPVANRRPSFAKRVFHTLFSTRDRSCDARRPASCPQNAVGPSWFSIRAAHQSGYKTSEFAGAGQSPPTLTTQARHLKKSAAWHCAKSSFFPTHGSASSPSRSRRSTR